MRLHVHMALAGVLLLALPGAARGGDFLGELTWPEAAALIAKRPVIVPVGAGAKEHGPHLPLNTDQLVLQHLLAHAVGEREVVVAPPVLHGWFPAFRDYPGTEVADAAVFQNYVREIALSLVRHGAKRIVFLNTGINRATGLPLAVVARDLVANHGVRTLVLSWDDLEGDATQHVYEQQRGGHADEGETSIMLALRPDLVHMARAEADYRSAPRSQIGYAPGRFQRAEESGVYGDPTLATAAKGEAILAVMRRRLVEALDQFAAVQ